jgi:rubrerythrin
MTYKTDNTRLAQRDKLRDRYINFNLWMFIVIMFASIFTQTLEAAPNRREANWRCKSCGWSQWHAHPDMWGDYYCNHCGAKK